MLRNASYLFVCAVTSTAPGQQLALDEVDRMARAELAKGEFAGCTIGVVRQSELVWAKSYGLADIEKRVPARNDHLYRIGSITKSFTGLALAQVVTDGRARMSDPVERHFPEFLVVRRPPDAAPITLWQLATMSSGLAREPRGVREFVRGPVSDWRNVLVRALRRTRAEHPPGSRYQYSNIGYAILGAAVSEAAGRPFVEHVQQRILQPLGMKDTVFEPNERVRKRIATGYTLVRGRPDATQPAREHDGRGYKVPNGALYTTVADLAKFVSFQLGHGSEQVLSKRAMRAHFARVAFADANLTSGYGLGFMVRRRGALVMVGHGGSVAGYNAAAWADRKSQVGVIVLRNVSGGRFRTGELCQRALAVVAKR